MMKQLLLSGAFLLTGAGFLNAQSGTELPGDFRGTPETAVSFRENKGQVYDQHNKPRPDVLFSGTDGALVYHLKNNGISYQLSRVDAWKEAFEATPHDALNANKQVPAQTTVYRVDVNWLNANSTAAIIKGEPQPGCDNYYTAACPDGAMEVKTYSDITYRNLYNGIDLKWYANANQLEYDYIVSPGADYRQIQLEFDGAISLHLDANGNLVIETPLGNFTQQAPLVIQDGKTLPSQWVLKSNRVTFHIENINPANAFTIDPLVRSWGTYYGGTGTEEQYGCTADALGNVYATGYTTSTTSIATVGAHQTVYGGGPGGWDAYLVKFNAAGVRQWCTYYGGADIDQGFSCAVDAGNNVFLAGITVSLSGIASPGSYQTVYGGGTGDAFLVKFNSNGVRQWGTYYGGSSVEQAYSCAIDPSGNIFISGYATSTTAIASVGSHQPALGGGYDAFLAKFAPNGVRIWGTYYGGTGSESFSYAATDLSGNVYLSGNTPSATGIATPGAHQPASGGGSTDGYLAKFNASGVRQWATYYGGTSTDAFRGCKTDASGNVYVTGFTQSASGIATPGAHQTVPGGSYDPMLVKFDPSGVRQWGTYYGGGTFEQGYSCAVNPLGEVYMTGYTSSTTGIANAPAYQATSGGSDDAFLVKFDPNGVVRWGTYYGGESTDQGYSCAVDLSGRVYLSGTTGSTLAIASPGAYQAVRSTPSDGYLVKFCDVSVALVSQTNILCNGGNSGAAQVSASGSDSFTYNWMPGNPAGDGTASVTGLTAGTWTCVITNNCGSTDSVFVNITQPNALASTSSASSILCNGGSATVTVNGSGGTSPYTGTGTFSVTAGGPYSYTVTDNNGCTSTTTITVTQPTALASSSSSTAILCNGGNATVTVNGSGGTAPYTGTGTFSVTAGGPYSYSVTDNNGCTSTTTITVTQPTALASSSAATAILCNGGNATVTVSGAGGTAPYTGTGTFSVTAGGPYSYTVTDNNGCTSTTTITVTQPTALASSSAATTIICNGGNATVTVNGSGGTAPYTGTGTFTVTAGGPYSYTVTDNNGCTSTTTITVIQPTALASSSSASSILCNGGNATVTVNGSGGTAPYTGTGTFSVTAGGPYSYTVTDNNGCTSTTTITITEPTALVTSTAANAILCNGGSSTVTVAASGGTAPYSGEGSFTETAGTYSYTVTDNNGCTDTATITITEPALLSATVTATTNPTTCSGTDGAVDITVSGGTMGYTFLWSNSSTGEDLSGVGAGAYSCTVTDTNGCTTAVTANLNDPNAPTVTLVFGLDTVCQATTAPFILTGGSPAGGTFTGPGVTGNTFDPMAANIGFNLVSYTYTDVNGCSGSTADSIYVDICLGVQQVITQHNFTIMPNPNNGKFTLQLNMNAAADVMIFDAIGQLVLTDKVQPHTQEQLHIETPGVYMITVVAADGSRSTQRIIVNR